MKIAVGNALVAAICFVAGLVLVHDGHAVISFLTLFSAAVVASTVISDDDDDDNTPMQRYYSVSGV